MTVKQPALKVVEDLPDQADWDDLMHAIYVRQKIAAGIRAGEDGRVHSHEEVKRKLTAS